MAPYPSAVSAKWWCLGMVLLLESHTCLRIGILVDKRVPKAVHETVTKILTSDCLLQYNKETLPVTSLIWRVVNHTHIIQLSEEVCSLMEEGIDGLISVLDPRSQTFVSSQVDTFQLPHFIICLEPCTCPLLNPYSRFISARHTAKVALLKDIIQYLGWVSIGFISDEFVDTIEQRDVLFTMSSIQTEVTISHINSTSHRKEIARKLEHLKLKGIRNLLLWTRRETTREVLIRAYESKLTGPDFNWLIHDESVSPSIDILNNISISHAVIISQSFAGLLRQSCLQRALPNTSVLWQTLVVDILEALIRLSSWEIPTDVVYNASVCGASKGIVFASNITNTFKRFKLGDLEDTLFKGFTDEGYPRTEAFELQSISRRGSTNLIPVASWYSHKGLVVHSNRGLFVNKFRDFRGITFRVTAKEEKPFVIRVYNGTEWRYIGLAFDILDELSEALNFKYVVVDPEDRRYGAPNDDDTWNGMVGMVKRQEVMMAIGPFSITALRDTVVDYTKPFMDDSIGILTEKSQPTPNLFQMMRPFSTPVWIVIAVSVLLGALLLTSTNRLTPYGTRYPVNEGYVTDEHAFHDNFWIIFASVMEQGAVYIPAANSSRCILGFWWVFTILIVSTYTANLAAFLTVADAQPSINTLNQLLQQDDLGVLVQDGSNLWSMFKDSNNDLYQEVWKRLEGSPSVDGLDAALPYVRTGKYAYVGDKSTLEYVANRECHSFVMGDESFNAGTYGLVLPENSPYKEAMDYYIMKMLEAGLIDNWRQKWWAKAENCTSKSRTGLASGLKLDTLGGVFIVYCACVFVATIILVISVVFDCKVRGQTPRRDSPCLAPNNNIKIATID